MLGASDTPLSKAYDAGLLDLDGVVYLGQAGIPHAADAVAAARADGMRIAFVTNNASRRVTPVAEHLIELGIPCRDEDVVTSVQAIVRWLGPRLEAGSKVLVVGSEDLASQIADGGWLPQRTAEGAAAVVQGLSPTTSWNDLSEAAVAIHRGALWVAGNTDATYPSARGVLPGNGALVNVLRQTTGREPVVVGKPEPELHAASVERVQAKRPLVVGDRLDTDILGATRAGTDSLLVLTGVTTRAHLLAAPVDQRPTYVSSDLRGLVEGHPAVVVQGEEARCRGARAWREDGEICASDDSDDALRAQCALAWR